MKTLIIDGYNVIYAIPQIEELLDESLELARQALIRLVSEFKGARRDIEKVYVVFDGKADGFDEETTLASGISAVYTRSGKEADNKIIELIRDSANPGFITVVSNDNFLYNNSRSLGARIMRVEEFQKALKR